MERGFFSLLDSWDESNRKECGSVKEKSRKREEEKERRRQWNRVNIIQCRERKRERERERERRGMKWSISCVIPRGKWWIKFKSRKWVLRTRFTEPFHILSCYFSSPFTLFLCLPLHIIRREWVREEKERGREEMLGDAEIVDHISNFQLKSFGLLLGLGKYWILSLARVYTSDIYAVFTWGKYFWSRVLVIIPIPEYLLR